MAYLDEYDGEDGTYFDVGDELVMLHELHKAFGRPWNHEVWL